jgi:hypothetical protein
MKIFPADDIGLDDLLSELIEFDHIKKIEVDGKSYGLVRNFRKYQRPKKPTEQYKLPNEYRNYVGLNAQSSETQSDKKGEVPHQFPTSGENPIQMEDGGDKVEEVIGESSSFHSEDSIKSAEKIKIGFNDLLETYPVEASKFKEAQKLYETAISEGIPHKLIIFSANRVRSEHFSKKPEDRKFTKRLNSWLAAQNFENDRKAWERSKQPPQEKPKVFEPKPVLPANHFLNKTAGSQA